MPLGPLCIEGEDWKVGLLPAMGVGQDQGIPSSQVLSTSLLSHVFYFPGQFLRGNARRRRKHFTVPTNIRICIVLIVLNVFQK